jgi:hypothetical protein
MSADMIIGLKSSVKRGFGLAEFWETSYKKTIPMLLQSWKLMEVEDGAMESNLFLKIEAMAWEVVQHYPHYKKVDSKDIGVFSTIGVKTIPAQTYETKKGVVKTTPEQKIPAHYTRGGDYLGRVSELGEKPISYKMYLHITPQHFVFGNITPQHFLFEGICDVNNIEGNFHLKSRAPQELGEVKSKDISKAERKAIKKPVLIDDDNDE